MKFELAIFDCDGVLIDSELLANRIDVECLQALGIEIDLDDYIAEYVGKSAVAVSHSIEERYTVQLPGDFWSQVEQKTLKQFQAELQPIPHVVELLTVLNKKCVASSSSADRLNRTLGMTGLYKYFSPHIFSAEQVRHGKPAPDLFLFAAQQMQVNPQDCVVIEDSCHGVQAGIDAGMTVVGFSGGSHIRSGHLDKLMDAGAAMVFADMGSLFAGLSQLVPQ
ncbi:HAD family hydrolase [Acaryochloris marina]|uniref:HAD-superfamily hydrolase subfamily IA, variant 3 n=1 Tax=Acaryochloris marina (strain MBIC 11017) TaxID=329726 RepID=B0C6Y7_ACAM1|nr:HAD family hydrolase [Acaryochloris marina]ABW28826.1 HAD-superfamily hydrolase subfamily IA, variant 3 [Acaryochloris marina MBIC11017]BDM77812.1 haloacid dehalogenase [Acaryochloris marina MBIC10699]